MTQLNMNDFLAVNEENSEILGKFVYFSLSNILIEKSELVNIITTLNLSLNLSPRTTAADSFKSATGDIYGRFTNKSLNNLEIFRVYCRDNKRDSGNIISRELVKETLGSKTNDYEKLANITYDKVNDLFEYDVTSYDSSIDPYEYCKQAEEFFELYRTCCGRKQIEVITDNFLNMMDALKISVHGKLFFVPKKSIHMVDLFEDFIVALNQSKKRGAELTVNSIFVMDNAKQREKMTSEFYCNVRKDIEFYQERISHLISSGSESAAIMDRWVLKVSKLVHQKQEYETLLQRELSGLDDELSTLKFLSQELQIRSEKIAKKRCA